jgi:ABC-type lipoprotein export system ATPase subunit
MSESQRALWRGRNIGVVFQFFQLLPTLTLLENTMLPMDYCNIHDFKERPDRALEILRMVGLEEHAHKMPSNVSSGQQQSAAIARALATDPPIILADEPTGNLDSRSAENILNLFEELATQGKTILIVTHDPTMTERTGQTVILSDGEVIDPMVVRALPMLDHPQMLTATHNTVKSIFPPGSMVIRQDEPVENFYMIARGEVEVVVNSRIPETRVARLGPGQFFGEVSLTMGVNAISGVRTLTSGPTELKLISKGDFLNLLKLSPRMADALGSVARLRMKETQGLIENYR